MEGATATREAEDGIVIEPIFSHRGVAQGEQGEYEGAEQGDLRDLIQKGECAVKLMRNEREEGRCDFV